MIDPLAGLCLWLGGGAYAPVVAPAPLEPLFQAAPGGTFNGLRLQGRSSEGEPTDPTSQMEVDARLFTDGRGVLQLDQLRLESGLASVRSRPLLGDTLDLALLGGQWETTWSFVDQGNLQVQVYSPSTLTLLGFSNTDFDADRRLKHYFAVGIGPGARITQTLVGRLGLVLEAEGMARTLNRHQRDDRNQVRHELLGEVSAGLAWSRPRHAAQLEGWAEVTTQWETRDADGLSGVDRQMGAFGVRLTFLTQAEPAPADEGDGPWPELGSGIPI